jgi:uncharacterized protein (DUF1778 family)
MKTRRKTSAGRSKGRRDTKSARVEIRLTPRQKDLLQRASALRGLTLSGYMAESAVTAAREELDQQYRIELNAAESARLAEILLNPPGPSQAAIEMVRDYRRGVRRPGF